MSTLIVLYYFFVFYTGAIARLPNQHNTGFNEENSLVKRSDDVSVAYLQTLVEQQAALIQQQAAAIQTLQTRVTALETKETQADTKITALEDQARKQVAFSASFSQDTTPVNIGQNNPIPFSHVTTNTGNGYNPHTGIFTAPISGLYAFYMTAREHTTTRSYVVVGILHSGTELCQTVVEGTATATWDKGSCFAAVRLNGGDEVHVQRIAGSDVIDKGWQTAFSGMLISADL